MRMHWTLIGLTCGLILSPIARADKYRLADVSIVISSQAQPMARLAADELRGYVYQLTRTYPPLAETPPAGKPAIIVRVGPGDKVPTEGRDPSQNFALYSTGSGQVIHGASERSTLWAAYTLLEHWGVGFYLGGDCLRPADPQLNVDTVDAVYRPALTIRGSLPWFNFLNSPTTWNPQDYKTFFAQMAKQKANLINFHAYDHEPFCGYEASEGQIVMAGPLMTTISEHRWWSPHATSTSDYLFGTSLFFNRGEWGCEVGIEDCFAPGRAVRLQQKMMADALRYARSLGIQTSLGFEVQGDPLDPKVQEGLRQRISYVLNAYPLDYLSIWQAEALGLAGAQGTREQDKGTDAAELWDAFGYLTDADSKLETAKRAEGVRMARHVRFAYQVMKELRPAMRMVVSGWGGDQHMRFTDYYEGLDKVVPKDVIFAALDNIDPRSADHVSDVYAKLQPERERWPVPWFESDAGHTRVDQTGPQTNVTAFEPLLRNIVAKRCEGALGIHWRTRNVQDVAGYLYRFGWNTQLTAEEYLKRYASDHYGPTDAQRMAQVHLRLEQFGPQYVGAIGTVECASKVFGWFFGAHSALLSHASNMAGILPDPARFPELESISRSAAASSALAAEQGDATAAVAYHDLSRTIDWLVKRARVGLAIWGDESPLEDALRQAEQAYTEGQLVEARKAAQGVLDDLQKYDFKSAVHALAATCRTRGELGMLATASARYSRYYAAFVARVARILGEPLTEAFGRGSWDGPAVVNLFPVPRLITADKEVYFDAVLLPASSEPAWVVELVRLGNTDASKITLPFHLLGGAYWRARFSPGQEGTFAWRLVPASKEPAAQQMLGPIEGVLTIRPALRAAGVVPSR